VFARQIAQATVLDPQFGPAPGEKRSAWKRVHRDGPEADADGAAPFGSVSGPF
jgi:hypothetical protein